MTYFCKLCDKTMTSLSKNKNFKSKTHISLTNSIIMSYIILNPTLDETDEIMRNYVNIHNKKYEEYDVHCLLHLVTTTNRVRCIRIKPQSSLHYSFYVPQKIILAKINQNRYHFSQIIEMRINSVSCIGHMTYEHYIKKTMPMGEIKLNQVLSRNVKSLNY